MSATIATAAVQTKLGTLTLPGTPTVWKDQAPLRDGSGNAVVPPYVVVGCAEGPVEWMADLDRVETSYVTLDVYAATQAACEAIVLAIQYGGQAPVNRAGLDDASALTLPTGYSLNKVERRGPPAVTQEAERGQAGGLVFRGVMRYAVELFVSGTGT